MESTNPSWANLQAGRPEQCTTAGERPDRDNLHPPHPHPFLFTHPPFLFPTPFFLDRVLRLALSNHIVRKDGTNTHALFVTTPLGNTCSSPSPSLHWLPVIADAGKRRKFKRNWHYSQIPQCLFTMCLAVPPGISLLLLQLCKIEQTLQ